METEASGRRPGQPHLSGFAQAPFAASGLLGSGLGVLLLCPNFPEPEEADEGQGVYLVRAGQALARRLGSRLRVVALRIGDQPERSDHPWVSIRRVSPPVALRDVFDLYTPENFVACVAALTAPALRAADELGGGAVAWIHGYECSVAASRLRQRGHPVVAVVHYSLYQESLETLGFADDPLRRDHLPGRATRAVSALCPGGWRSQLVRGIGRIGALPHPAPRGMLGVQLHKLGMERQLLGAAHRTVAVGEAFAHSLARLHPRRAGRIRSCAAGAPPIRGEPRPAPVGRRRILLSVGRPTPQKGWDHLAAALLLLEQQRPALARRIELRLVGGKDDWRGPNTTFGAVVREQFDRLRLVEVRHLGRLSHGAVQACYAAADLFVLPSSYEPFGLVLLEAMAQGCPVLASDVDGPRDLVTDELGWCVPWADVARRPASLAAGLVVALGEPRSRWIERSAAAMIRASSYSWEACAAAHERLLLEAKEERKPR